VKAVAAFVMRSRYQAALVGAITAILALLIPPLLIISIAAVILPTLRLGHREGVLVAVIATGAASLLLLPAFGFGSLLEAGQLLAFYWLPGWLLGVVLRWSVSLAFTMISAATLGIVVILGFFLLLEDPVQWGLTLLRQMVVPLMQSTQLVENQAALEEFLALVSPFMPGFVVSGFVTILLGGLLLGRWWQALLYRPGGFRSEFHELRLGKLPALLSVAVVVLGVIFNALPLANLVPTLLVLYTVQSFALVHGLVGRARLSQGWLIGFYVLMLFAPQFMLLVALLALMDPWVDFRHRVGRTPPGGRGDGSS